MILCSTSHGVLPLRGDSSSLWAFVAFAALVPVLVVSLKASSFSVQSSSFLSQRSSTSARLVGVVVVVVFVGGGGGGGRFLQRRFLHILGGGLRGGRLDGPLLPFGNWLVVVRDVVLILALPGECVLSGDTSVPSERHPHPRRGIVDTCDQDV